MLLLKGEPKTLQVESVKQQGLHSWSVLFKKNPKDFVYSDDNVVWLTDPTWLDPQLCRVYRAGQWLQEVAEIWQYSHQGRNYWRIRYQKGTEAEYSDAQVSVQVSCLSDERARSTFDYMRTVATINPLGRNESEQGILTKLYDSLHYIDPGSAAACYLTPEACPPKAMPSGALIFPFGCNTSQKQAVTAAFQQQISVIQGPPGTGKTQTILNILANIVREGKTVMVVSNNNAATTNVQEKLAKQGLSFIVAPLGNRSNKEQFLKHQPELPEALPSWQCSVEEQQELRERLSVVQGQLDRIYELQNRLAALRQELQALELEWRHFSREGLSDEEQLFPSGSMSSPTIIKRWLQLQQAAEQTDGDSASWLSRLKWWWFKLICSYRWQIRLPGDKRLLRPLITKLQTFYYQTRLKELQEAIALDESALSHYDAALLSEALTDDSLRLFKHALAERYADGREPFSDWSEIRRQGNSFMKQYPVVLSTTFSACTCQFGGQLYDYIIMDEASQVSVETGTLALSCARRAVIVGDVLQLPNVVTDADRVKLNGIKKNYSIADGYDSASNSFLLSVCRVIPQLPQTLLREHYRCHPRIINFCNQKFYGGNLLIMTADREEPDVLCAFRTVKGNHAFNQYNQREIDVVKQEVLPTLAGYDDIAIITPYNHQVDAFNKQLTEVEAATVHKYQGREKEAIIMSTVDNQITPFADDAQLLNVAVSRAKCKFCLVTTGNEQEHHGNIMDLLDYIHYNNCTITESKVASIFDYLYEQYTAQRMKLLAALPQVSAYASENLTYHLLQEVIASDSRFACCKVLNHVPLRQMIQDSSLMSAEELQYVSHDSTHVDFLIISSVSKKPLMGIETDGISFHHEQTEQHRRDELKDHIFELYELPLLRLSTKGSGEKERIVKQLLERV